MFFWQTAACLLNSGHICYLFKILCRLHRFMRSSNLWEICMYVFWLEVKVWKQVPIHRVNSRQIAIASQHSTKPNFSSQFSNNLNSSKYIAQQLIHMCQRLMDITIKVRFAPFQRFFKRHLWNFTFSSPVEKYYIC